MHKFDILILIMYDYKVKERPDVGVYVKDLSSYVMNNADDLDKTMTLGNKNSKLIIYVNNTFFDKNCEGIVASILV